MQSMPSEDRRSSSVMAMFEDGLSTFLLSCDATFEDLAGRLGQIGERHQGRPIAINVKLGSRRQDVRASACGPRQFGIRRVGARLSAAGRNVDDRQLTRAATISSVPDSVPEALPLQGRSFKVEGWRTIARRIPLSSRGQRQADQRRNGFRAGLLHD